MNLLELKAVCAAYHNVEVADLTNGPVDLFLVAANNVRKKLEKFHDFELCRTTATLVIDSVAGGRLDDAVIVPPDDEVFSSIREMTEVNGLQSNGQLVPLDFTRADIAIERERYELELSDDLWPSFRYPSDAQWLARTGQSSLVIRGRTLYSFPRLPLSSPDNGPFTLYLDGYGWLKDYTPAQLDDETATAQDFLLEHGFEYLQWRIIDELNQKFQTYVPRQEGNVGPPKDRIAEALKDLVLWDSYSVDPYTTRSRG